MSKLSQPMRDTITAATDEGLLTVGTQRTVGALQTRGLVDTTGLNLTSAGLAMRAELTKPDQGDVNPIQEDTVKPSETAVETLNDTPEGEDTQEDDFVPYVVPNREDRRKGVRVMSALRKALAGRRDKQAKEAATREKSRKVKRGKFGRKAA